MITRNTKMNLIALAVTTGMLATIWSAWGACPATSAITNDHKSRREFASGRSRHQISAANSQDPSSDCAAGKPFCYDTPVHLNSLINTPGFEGKPSLSADGLELYFVSDRSGALGGPGDQDIYVSRR
ncbi:MAG TPA: hypothetical protein VF899_16775, partial [Pyrinomonadaceae bacterium]